MRKKNSKVLKIVANRTVANRTVATKISSTDGFDIQT